MSTPLSRRRFVWGAMGAGGGLSILGTAVNRQRTKKHETSTSGTTFKYDLSAYMDTDPALDRYQEATTPTKLSLQLPTCLAADGDATLYVGGDKRVLIYSAAGRKTQSWELADTPTALHVDESGRVYIATKRDLQIRDADGRVLLASVGRDDACWFTSIATIGEDIYLADARGKRILVYRRDGSAKTEILAGKQGDAAGRFVIPSPYFDIAASPEGLLSVANTGEHRIEQYTSGGTFVNAWGHASMGIEGFVGCCNPADFMLLPDGRYVTSEKGLNRIKIHRPDGTLDGVVASPRSLVADASLAAQACSNCSIGYSLDLATDRHGTVFALDPASRSVRAFTALA